VPTLKTLGYSVQLLPGQCSLKTWGCAVVAWTMVTKDLGIFCAVVAWTILTKDLGIFCADFRLFPAGDILWPLLIWLPQACAHLCVYSLCTCLLCCFVVVVVFCSGIWSTAHELIIFLMHLPWQPFCSFSAFQTVATCSPGVTVLTLLHCYTPVLRMLCPIIAQAIFKCLCRNVMWC
jgi:hypothetical protein